MSLTLQKRAFLWVMLPLALQIVLFVTLAVILGVAENQSNDDYRSKEVTARTNYLCYMNYMASTALVAHLLDKDPIYLNTYESAKKVLSEKEYVTEKQARPAADRIADLFALGDPALRQVQVLEASTSALFEKMDEILKLSQPLISDYRPSEFKPLWLQLARARTDLLAIDRARYQASPYTVPRMRHLAENTLFSVLVAIDVLAGFVLAKQFDKHVGSRLLTLMDNTFRFAQGRDLNRPISGADELSIFDTAFHDMSTQVLAGQQALSEKERRMRLLVNSVPVALFAVDSGLVIQHANPAAARLFSTETEPLAPLDAVVLVTPDQSGTTSADVLVQQRLPAVMHFTEEQLSSLIELARAKPVETFCHLPSGQIPVELSVTFLGESETATQLITVRDLTDRYEAERLKREFMAMVGHDLKSPLTVIDGFLDLLKSGALGSLNENGARLCNRSEAQVERLSRLVSDLTDVSQIESGQFKLAMAQTNIAEIQDLAYAAVVDQASGRKINVAVEKLDHKILADKQRIVQVIVNLVGNAIKFSPEESTITLSAKSEGEWIVVSVTDQGRGIPKEHRERIFERFQQVSSDDSQAKGGGGLGLGLGLAICKAIVHQHRGLIGVDSEVGKGSTFWIRLPLAPADFASR